MEIPLEDFFMVLEAFGMAREEAVKGICQVLTLLEMCQQEPATHVKVSHLCLVGGTRILILGGLLI